MRKSLTRTLYLIGLLIVIIGAVINGINLVGIHVDQATKAVTGGNPGLLLVAGIVLFLGSIISCVAWIGALVKMAQLGRWGWFVCLIVFSGITMLIYVFGGPETRAESAQMNS